MSKEPTVQQTSRCGRRVSCAPLKTNGHQVGELPTHQSSSLTDRQRQNQYCRVCFCASYKSTPHRCESTCDGLVRHLAGLSDVDWVLELPAPGASVCTGYVCLKDGCFTTTTAWSTPGEVSRDAHTQTPTRGGRDTETGMTPPLQPSVGSSSADEIGLHVEGSARWVTGINLLSAESIRDACYRPF